MIRKSGNRFSDEITFIKHPIGADSTPLKQTSALRVTHVAVGLIAAV
jgi:hypothetical protein